MRTQRRAYRAAPSSLPLATAVALAAFPAIATAQEAPAANSSDPIGILMMFTIGAALAIGVLLLVLFLRKRSNREAMRRLNNE